MKRFGGSSLAHANKSIVITLKKEKGAIEK